MDEQTNLQNENKAISEGYEKASDDYLREALKRTYTERFKYATMLYKVQKTMEKAKITHKKMDK